MSFTTRVELHDANWNDYETLHDNMRRQGFTQTIRSNDGTLYELPPAEYNYENDATRKEVIAKAKTAAGMVKSSYEVLVTESSGRTWHGLKKIE